MKTEPLTLRRKLALEIARQIENNRAKEHPLKQLFWECTSRPAPVSVPTITKGTFTRTTSWKCGKTSSTLTETGNGCGRENAPIVSISDIARAMECTFATRKENYISVI